MYRVHSIHSPFSFTRALLVDQHIEACHMITAPRPGNVFTWHMTRIRKCLKIRPGFQWQAFVDAVRR